MLSARFRIVDGDKLQKRWYIGNISNNNQNVYGAIESTSAPWVLQPFRRIDGQVEEKYMQLTNVSTSCESERDDVDEAIFVLLHQLSLSDMDGPKGISGLSFCINQKLETFTLTKKRALSISWLEDVVSELASSSVVNSSTDRLRLLPLCAFAEAHDNWHVARRCLMAALDVGENSSYYPDHQNEVEQANQIGAAVGNGYHPLACFLATGIPPSLGCMWRAGAWQLVLGMLRYELDVLSTIRTVKILEAVIIQHKEMGQGVGKVADAWADVWTRLRGVRAIAVLLLGGGRTTWIEQLLLGFEGVDNKSRLQEERKLKMGRLEAAIKWVCGSMSFGEVQPTSDSSSPSPSWEFFPPLVSSSSPALRPVLSQTCYLLISRSSSGSGGAECDLEDLFCDELDNPNTDCLSTDASASLVVSLAGVGAIESAAFHAIFASLRFIRRIEEVVGGGVKDRDRINEKSPEIRLSEHITQSLISSRRSVPVDESMMASSPNVRAAYLLHALIAAQWQWLGMQQRKSDEGIGVNKYINGGIEHLTIGNTKNTCFLIILCDVFFILISFFLLYPNIK